MPYSPEQKQRDSGQQPDSEEAEISLWPETQQDPEAGINFALAFHGLFCFAYNETDGVCEVGVHAKAPDHDFKVFVVEFDESDEPQLRYPESGQPLDSLADPIVIDVHQPQTPGVRFFQLGTSSGELDDRDWRRVPDLEGPDFYNVELEKIRGTLNPIITIRHGLFYTALPTEQEFVRVADENVGDIHDLDRLAYCVAANVSHQPGGHVSLRIGGTELKLEATEGKKYLIYFSNSCPGHKPNCIFDPKHPNKEKRNDFHLYFKTFKRPPNDNGPGLKPEFLLVKKSKRKRPTPLKSEASSAFLNFCNSVFLRKLVPTSTHEAPCGATGFGQTGGGFPGGG